MGTIPPLLLQVIEATVARARSMDMDALLASKNATPRQIAPDEVLEQRHNFLREQFRDELSSSEIEQTFERIISGNELQDVNYLEKGTIASRAVCRLVLRARGGGYATGFLISDSVLITNNHVFPDAESARVADAQFRYERGLDGNELKPVVFKLEPDRLFFTSKALDFSVVAIADRDVSGATAPRAFGCLPLVGITGKVAEGEWLTIIQHPAGQLKQLCVRENQLLRRTDDFLWYSTDTLAGSSGSPVFSNDWLIVALHHSGVPERKNGVIQTVLGRDFDPRIHKETDIKWIANEGVRVSRIVDTLRENIPDHPLIKPIITPAAPSAVARPKPQEAAMGRRINVQLEVSDDGDVRVVGSEEAAFAEAAKKGPTDSRGNVIDAPADRTFKGEHLEGYEPTIGDYKVHLPELDPSIAEDAAPLIDHPTEKELKYEHFSVVMSQSRRLAFFSAANVSAGGRYILSGRDDAWLVDSRISRQHQIDNSYYLRNKLDRGHLTRREDLEYGTKIKYAVRSANGTCVFTNCVPQLGIFNQGKAKGVGDDARLWAGLEQYILENVDEETPELQVFTGPIFSDADPKYRGHKIPLEFWKVAAGIAPDGALFATAYLLSQENLIDVSKLDDEAARELPLGAYLTYQRKVSDIENMTGLRFFFKKNGGKKTPLSECDPLEKRKPRRRRRSADANEAFGGGDDFALESFEQIVLP